MENDTALFLAEMADVKPLSPSASVLPHTRQDSESQQIKLQRSQFALKLQDLSIDVANIKPVLPDDELSFKQDGVQNGVFKQFKLGHYPVQASLDVHQYSVEKARSELLSFIEHAKSREWRNVLVIHGKGVNNKPIAALMKSFVNHWLGKIDGVMAYHSAPQLMGATGAVLVMLEKSENQRDFARETNYKGAGKR